MGGGGEVRYLRHGDQRVVRLVSKSGVKALGIYLGPFEYQRRTGTTSYTKLVLHVNGHGRHAQAEVVLDGSDPDSLDVFYVHGDHLGSGHVLTKDDATLLSQEEFFPLRPRLGPEGCADRYRYIGVERDEDSGLCMTGPRTYDPMSGRFLQGDPLAPRLAVGSPFSYASVNPLARLDSNGYKDDEVAATSSRRAEGVDRTSIRMICRKRLATNRRSQPEWCSPLYWHSTSGGFGSDRRRDRCWSWVSPGRGSVPAAVWGQSGDSGPTGAARGARFGGRSGGETRESPAAPRGPVQLGRAESRTMP